MSTSEQRKQIIDAFLQAMRLDERAARLAQADFDRLRGYLEKDLSGDSVRRWAAETGLADMAGFMVAILGYCWRHIGADEFEDASE